uniref:Uncharacterized protein n=1 Tax=Meloidogyne enterolobii TaxID=390850 RepID=A0A6V7WAT1_MELEN|nr:unnamed protein product [Meloidogyne enterolobii]
MVECNSFLNDREKDFENEEIFENYINIKLLNKLIKTTKLFNLPQLLLNISLDIQKQFNNKREEKNLILKLNLNEEKEGINFTNCLNFLEKFWKNEEEKGEENNNWKNKIEIIQNLAIVIEILGLSLVACKLLENTCNCEEFLIIFLNLILSAFYNFEFSVWNWDFFLKIRIILTRFGEFDLSRLGWSVSPNSSANRNRTKNLWFLVRFGCNRLP